LKPGFEACGKLALDGVTESYGICSRMADLILVDQKTNDYRFNMYDHTKPCPAEFPLCYDWDYLDKFFNSKVTKAAEGFGPTKKWQDCDNEVYAKLSKKDNITDVSEKLAFLIESGLKVLIYAGERDFICNWVGTESMINNLDWSGRKNFNYSQYITEAYGEKKCFSNSKNNLAFVKFKEAGHLVPMDQPELSLEMIESFVEGD